MWKAATKQITGTNDGEPNCITLVKTQCLTLSSVPLGNRRRFGPAPVETAPPQLAQPSPSAFPRAPDQESPGKRAREETPTPNDGKCLSTGSKFVVVPNTCLVSAYGPRRLLMHSLTCLFHFLIRLICSRSQRASQTSQPLG